MQLPLGQFYLPWKVERETGKKISIITMVMDLGKGYYSTEIIRGYKQPIATIKVILGYMGLCDFSGFTYPFYNLFNLDDCGILL